MGKFSEIFKYACNNDIKSLNKSIEVIGHRHHATYLARTMFVDDININYHLLSEIQHAIDSFCQVICDNNIIKKNAQSIFVNQCNSIAPLKQNFDILTKDQLLELVYQHAMKYYFGINVINETGSNSLVDEAIQYRIVSNFLQSDIERILIKMYEDIEIIIEDTKNIDFLLRNYKKINQSNDMYHCILGQLVESIQNVVLRDNKFEEEYFITVRKISLFLQNNFYGE